MIDGFIMRDPGSYDDIIDILTDEKVITDDMSESLKTVINFRKMLVQQYIEVDHGQVQSMLKEEINALKQFAPKVRDYLTNELGPVSAFKSDVWKGFPVKKYEGYLIDLDGTMYRGKESIPEAAQFVARLNKREFPTYLSLIIPRKRPVKWLII